VDLGEVLKEKELEGVRIDMLQWPWLMVLTLMAGSLAELLPKLPSQPLTAGKTPLPNLLSFG